MTSDKLMTVKQAAGFLKVNPWQVYKWIRDGLIEAHPLGPVRKGSGSRPSLRIWLSDLIAFVNKDKTNADKR